MKRMTTKPLRFNQNRKYRRWNEHEEGMIRHLFFNGNSPPQIANIMRRTVSSICVKLSRMNLVYLDHKQEHMHTIADLAFLLNVHPKLMYRYATEIGTVSFGRQKYITKQNLHHWLMMGYADYFLHRDPPCHPDIIPALQAASQEYHERKWMVTRQEVLQALGIANSTLSNHIYSRNFPKPFILPNKTTVFVRQDVDEWVEKYGNGKKCVWS